jgi:hypothetical protein
MGMGRATEVTSYSVGGGCNAGKDNHNEEE